MYKIYAIKDNLAGDFWAPELAQEDALYIRKTKYIMHQDTKQMIYTNASDYSIYKLGEFDVKTGKIVSCDPEFVVNLIDLKEVDYGKAQV